MRRTTSSDRRCPWHRYCSRRSPGLFDLIDPFYLSLTGPLADRMYETGQFFEAPALYLIKRYPMDILTGRYDEATRRYDYRVEQADRESFRKPHEPLQPLGLRTNERAAIVPCKLRPVVLVSRAASPWKDGHREGDDAYLVAPVYSFKGDDRKEEYSPLMIERIRSYVYPEFFYLPGNERPHLAEGFIRLDRIQPVHKDWLYRRSSLRLSEDALSCFQSWLSLYLAPETTPDSCPAPGESVCAPKWAQLILDYRRQRIEELALG